ncbi:MAG: hypothetical protein ABIS21_07040 [Acidimicrobiales bacterium]
MARGVALAAIVVAAMVAMLSSVRPAVAADVTGVAGLPTPSTTIPVVTVPTVTVPSVTVPTVTVPRVSVTVAPPRVNLREPPASTSPGGSTAGSGPVPTPAVTSPPATVIAPASPPVLTGAPNSVTRARKDDPADRTLAVRLRRAGVETVQQLTFPLGLALAMSAFLVFQHSTDKRDPRVAASLDSDDDDLLGFS